MSPIIRECKHLDLDYFILHTGQHYSYSMDKVFFEQLDLPLPKYCLDIGSGSNAEQTGKMLIGIEKVLLEEEPDIVLVEGDTNTVLAGALAAYKLCFKVGHVEAGLRSYDRRMAEEINRILTDHCSDYLFAPTENSRRILLGEGIAASKIFVTGNTVVDAIYQNLDLSEQKGNPLTKFGLKEKEYFVVTLHRQENVDYKDRFSSILNGLELVKKEYGLPIIYPVHPRAGKMMKFFDLNPKITLIDPVDYLTFLQLEKNAKLILTDSGGVQEEACILGVPCVTLRDNTERPETLDIGANVLAGTDAKNILNKTNYMIKENKDWVQPFGSGTSAIKIINILNTQYG